MIVDTGVVLNRAIDIHRTGHPNVVHVAADFVEHSDVESSLVDGGTFPAVASISKEQVVARLQEDGIYNLRSVDGNPVTVCVVSHRIGENPNT